MPGLHNRGIGQERENLISNFIAELRRRRVFRVIVLYAIAGWIVIEVTSTVLPGLNLPDWTTTLVILLGALDTIQRHLEMNPHDTRALYFGAQNLVLVGENEKGRELAERALGQDQDEPVVLYNVACFYALQDNHDRSIELLTRAIDQGWGDKEWLETDSDLNVLRKDERFKALLKRIDQAN